ncbi:MAG: two-component regulator propeller domain-containing protein [Ginsengibacter sp.]
MRKVIIALLLFHCTASQAQYKKTFFNTLNVATGLPEADVQASLQDKYGYMWLGTQNGLVRYDGYNLKRYPMHDADGQEIVAASVNWLFEDREGKLWINVWTKGFYYLDRTRDVFVKQKWNDPAKDLLTKNGMIFFYATEDKQPQVYWIGMEQLGKIPFKLLYFDALHHTMEEFSAGVSGKNYIPAIQTIDIRNDAAGKIWVIADSLLSYFDPASKSFKPYFVLPENPKENIFESFQPDPVDPDILWMNTHDRAFGRKQELVPYPKRVIQFNTKTKKYKNFLPDSSLTSALPANGLHIYTDSFKRVWVSTKKGISLFNRENGTFTNYALPFSFKYGLLTSDNIGNLWMTNGSGLKYLNTKTGIVTSYIGNDDAGDLPGGRGIDKMFFDRSGIFWVNTPYAGISYLDRLKSLFTPIPVMPNGSVATENTKPGYYSIAGNQGDSICFVSDTSSLFAWYINSNKFDKIDLRNKDVKSITSVVTGKDGSLWIASNGQGLFNYNPLTRSVINYRLNRGDSLSLSSSFVQRLAIDKEGVLWIGTVYAGLCSFNKQTGKFTRYPFIINDGTIKANNTLDDQDVESMSFDSEGILWIGTNMAGLNRFDPKTGMFTSYFDFKKGFSTVISIFEDSHKRLWVGTYLGGLFLFDIKNGTFKRYSEKDGLLNNNTSQIFEDADGNILSFNEIGISRLNPSNNVITNFKFKDLNTGEFDVTGGYKDSKDNFHFSTPKGIVNFNPEWLNGNLIPPAVVIESVSYRAANPNLKPDTVLFIEGRQKITLAYNENKIAIQYVALHFANASQNKYAYQLLGYDKDWIKAGTERTAIYTNLSPGTYTFKVKAANSDGVWNETGASVDIVILPPWWKTWWAYLLYAVIFIGAISSFIAYRSATLKRENKLLEEKVELRTTQLKSSIADLKSTQSQLIQSEKMASLGVLTAGIAHEIQNPLNFVNNFSEVNKEMLEELKAERLKPQAERDEQTQDEIINDVIDNSEKINHHGKRAGNIVKGMLEHSRSSTGVKEPTDINALADEYLRLSYHGLRAKDKSFSAVPIAIGMKTDFDETVGKINIIPQDIGRVLLNLYNNAFYACNERSRSTVNQQISQNLISYEPTVSVTTKKLEDSVIITVSDNGNGIPEKVKDKIFQPFFTTKPTGQGTGLGLSLSYDIIKVHGGEIKVESKEGEGSTFIIQLPFV